MAGVSSFQVHFADHDILTPGDAPDVLVAMNPAALRANIADVPRGATIIVDTHDFAARNLTKAGYDREPARGRHASSRSPCTTSTSPSLTVEAVKEFGLSRKDAARAKNMFALGLLSWMYGRPTEPTIEFLTTRFAAKPTLRDANVTAFRTGWNFGETTESFAVRYEIKPASMPTGRYRNITGNAGAVVRADRGRQAQSGLPLFLGVVPDHAGLRRAARAVASTSASG